jgi:hypothetical protein
MFFFAIAVVYITILVTFLSIFADFRQIGGRRYTESEFTSLALSAQTENLFIGCRHVTGTLMDFFIGFSKPQSSVPNS